MIEVIFLGNYYRADNSGQGFAGAVFSQKGLCPTLTTMGGGGRQPQFITEIKNEQSNRETIKNK